MRRLLGLLLALALVTTRPALAMADDARRAEAPGPIVVTPAQGAIVPYDQDLTVRVRPVAGATGYLYSFSSPDAMVWENYRDEGRLDGTSYTIAVDSPGHRAIRPDGAPTWGLKVGVRAYVGDPGAEEWTAVTNVGFTLAAQPSPPSTDPGLSQPSATPGPSQPSTASGPAGALYSADWSAGMNGWSGAGPWQTLRGELLSTGTDSGEAIAPWDPAGRADYAVEAEIRSHPGSSSFGLFVRRGTEPTGYIAVIGTSETWLAGLAAPFGSTLAEGDFDRGEGWHRYRLEADGNVLTFSVDGAPLLTASDNQYLSPGRAGLWTSGQQIDVRSFRVLAS
ncbi:hypothetical protein ACQPZX_27490 [Actinoplanes sp. CA-142083]|uniref:hypothetical protein n=1 Tax=Actinoplanes sp. CA-142083 TaxID=3239903 RepID=UPI003D944B19